MPGTLKGKPVVALIPCTDLAYGQLAQIVDDCSSWDGSVITKIYGGTIVLLTNKPESGCRPFASTWENNPRFMVRVLGEGESVELTN